MFLLEVIIFLSFNVWVFFVEEMSIKMPKFDSYDMLPVTSCQN